MDKCDFLDIPPLHPNQKGYRVVFEKQGGNLKLEKSERKQLEELHVKVQEEPQKHLNALVQFCQRHPAVPEAANLLAFAYLKLKKRKEAEELIEKTYLNHPHYLIARINYADQALRLKKPERIPSIFNGCFDLNLLYPEKTSFYYAEFRGFMTVMGFYHLEIGEKEKAEEYYQMAFQVDPLHPSVAALEKALTKSPWWKKIFAR
jgi:tetratricopeptide (TPR) repeat protein